MITDKEKKLRARESKLTAERYTLLALMEQEDRGPTDRERRRCDDIKRELESVDRELELETRRNAPSTPITYDTVGSIADGPRHAPSSVVRRTPGQAPTFATLFPSVELSDNGFGSLEEYLSVVHRGRHDDRLYAAQRIGTPSAGGFALEIPTRFASELFDRALEESVFASKAKLEPMISDSVKVSTFDVSTAAGGSPVVGLDPRWEPELGTLTEDEAKLRQIHLRAKKCIVYVTASNEVIADGGSYHGNLTFKGRRFRVGRLGARVPATR